MWFTYQPIGSSIKTLRIVNEEQRRDAWHEYITIDDITWLLDMSMHVIIVMLLCSADIITNSIIIIRQLFLWSFLNLDFIFKIIIFKFLNTESNRINLLFNRMQMFTQFDNDYSNYVGKKKISISMILKYRIITFLKLWSHESLWISHSEITHVSEWLNKNYIFIYLLLYLFIIYIFSSNLKIINDQWLMFYDADLNFELNFRNRNNKKLF